MPHKQFAERLNRELDNIGVPMQGDERIDAFAKLVKIPKFKAQAILNGISMPNQELLEIIASELELNPEWLTGVSDNKLHKNK